SISRWRLAKLDGLNPMHSPVSLQTAVSAADARDHSTALSRVTDRPVAASLVERPKAGCGSCWGPLRPGDRRPPRRGEVVRARPPQGPGTPQNPAFTNGILARYGGCTAGVRLAGRTR